MSDEQLDRDWKPNGRRPQSTMARTFSQELMDIFRIENSISDLDTQVDKRKQDLDKNNEELASLEARIREMEDRLKKNSPSRPPVPRPDDSSAAAASASAPDSGNGQFSKDEKSRSRPGTARTVQSAPGSGIMPPTPGASEDGDNERG